MRTRAALRMHHYDGVPLQQAERDQAFFTVSLANIFACNGEAVPDGVTPREIETVIFDVAPALRFVPSCHSQIVITKYLLRKGNVLTGLTFALSGVNGRTRIFFWCHIKISI